MSEDKDELRSKLSQLTPEEREHLMNDLNRLDMERAPKEDEITSRVNRLLDQRDRDAKMRKRRNWRNGILTFLAVLAIGGGGYGVYHALNDTPDEQETGFRHQPKSPVESANKASSKKESSKESSTSSTADQDKNYRDTELTVGQLNNIDRSTWVTSTLGIVDTNNNYAVAKVAKTAMVKNIDAANWVRVTNANESWSVEVGDKGGMSNIYTVTAQSFQDSPALFGIYNIQGQNTIVYFNSDMSVAGSASVDSTKDLTAADIQSIANIDMMFSNSADSNVPVPTE